MNCWEYKNCGRELNGKNSHEFGVCPASTEKIVDGVHGGKNGGRCCWAIAGTFCNGKVQGGVGSKAINCMVCDFYKKTWKEEQGPGYKNPSQLIAMLQKN